MPLFLVITLGIYFFLDQVVIRQLLRRSNIIKNQSSNIQIELPLKVFELLFSTYFLITSVVLIGCYYSLPKHDLQLDHDAFIFGLMMQAYFIYHLMYLIKGHGSKLFIMHHILMIGLCYIILSNHILFLYLIIAAIPFGSTWVRGWQWWSSILPKQFKRIPPNAERMLYLFFQLGPILFIFIHFMFFNSTKLDPSILIELSIIGLGAAGIAIYIIKNQLISLYYLIQNKLESG